MGLRRELSLFEATVAGVGIILGAGIYALIGVATGVAGNAVWLSFLIAALIATLTGLSYAELSSMFPRDGAEYEYTKHFFGKSLARLIGLMILTSGVVSAATVALGFGGYLAALIPLPVIIMSLGLIGLCLFINYHGIRESSRVNIFFTAVELIGLLIIIVLGITKWGSVDYLHMPHGFVGVLKASALVFFAYMGFEAIVTLTEETKNARKSIPRAIMWSVVITSVVYVLVAISAVSLLDWQSLGNSAAPMADVAAASLGSFAFVLLGIIALFSTANTVLMQSITSSRLIYGMASDGVLPKILKRISATNKTPIVAIGVVGVLIILFTLIGDIELVANITTVFLFATFAIINLTVIILRYIAPTVRRPFRIPLTVGKAPILPLLGAVSAGVLLYFAVGNILQILA